MFIITLLFVYISHRNINSKQYSCFGHGKKKKKINSIQEKRSSDCKYGHVGHVMAIGHFEMCSTTEKTENLRQIYEENLVCTVQSYHCYNDIYYYKSTKDYNWGGGLYR